MNFVTKLGVAYETELGEVGEQHNKAKIKGTKQNYWTYVGEKESKNNVKADFNIGLENKRFGATVNFGYDSDGNNFRGGIGFRAIY